jgi:hypothetical protein
VLALAKLSVTPQDDPAVCADATALNERAEAMRAEVVINAMTRGERSLAKLICLLPDHLCECPSGQANTVSGSSGTMLAKRLALLMHQRATTGA